MSLLNEFFLNGSPNEVGLECLSLSHSSWPADYHYVRNMSGGGLFTLEDATTQQFNHYPFKLSGDLISEELDQPINITVGDLGELVPELIDLMKTAGLTSELPKAVLRLYSSANLAAPMEVVVRYVTSVSRNAIGATLKANAPHLDKNRTGEIYSLERFPTLRFAS
jgi:hypothetical protein